MSMVLSLVALGDANIERVLRDPPLIWRVAAPDEPELYEDARAEQRKTGILSRLFGRKSASETKPDLLLEEPEGTTVDLDQAWAGIHYLLTGSAWSDELPLGFLTGAGKVLVEITVGHAPPRLLDAGEVRSVRDALAQVGEEELRSRFDPQELLAMQIYPEIWADDPADTFAYLLENYRRLRKFVDETAGEGLGLVVLVT